jgi:hypothetical protein
MCPYQEVTEGMMGNMANSFITHTSIQQCCKVADMDELALPGVHEYPRNSVAEILLIRDSKQLLDRRRSFLEVANLFGFREFTGLWEEVFSLLGMSTGIGKRAAGLFHGPRENMKYERLVRTLMRASGTLDVLSHLLIDLGGHSQPYKAVREAPWFVKGQLGIGSAMSMFVEVGPVLLQRLDRRESVLRGYHAQRPPTTNSRSSDDIHLEARG